jgi:hypothetical protein
MIDIIAAHNWKVGEQNFLEIKGTEYTLSVVPEFTYFSRDEEGKVIRSRTPIGYKLNCAVQGPVTFMGHTSIKNLFFEEFYSEEDFYAFMINFVNESNKYINSMEQAI